MLLNRLFFQPLIHPRIFYVFGFYRNLFVGRISFINFIQFHTSYSQTYMPPMEKRKLLLERRLVCLVKFSFIINKILAFLLIFFPVWIVKIIRKCSEISLLIIAFVKVLSKTQLVRILSIIAALFLQILVDLSIRGINPNSNTSW